MKNLSKIKTPMPAQAPEVRAHNFREVALGYSPEQAMEEARRCLDCKAPACVAGCPVNIRIPDFIREIAAGNFARAYEIISETNTLPALSGRVCPQESQCECRCVRGKNGEPVAIGRLERFAADWYRENVNTSPVPAASNGVRIAVVGSGPAGLTCAGDLARLGYRVSVFEALHTPGGVLVYGIPQFRAGFIGSGAGLPMSMHIPGEALKGVYSANEYLTRINLMKAYDERYDTPIIRSNHVAVVGGGNVAMDAARCALRLGAAKVYIVYRRSEAELPARAEEVAHAKQEGVEFLLLHNPVAILGDVTGRAAQMKCIRMELGEPDASGRRRPIPIPGSEMTLDVDTVIMALGTSPNPLLHSATPGLEVNRKGCLIVDEQSMTTRDGVYAGGDAVTGAATVILAMGAGKKAAAEIHKRILAEG